MMMLQTIIMMVVCVLQTRGVLEHPTECPQWCKCEDAAAQCERGSIPQMEQKITTFHLKNANPPILELSPTITRQLQHLVGYDEFSFIDMGQ